MSCLGERLTALVDGELGHEERDRALAHLAGCAPCKAEADELRRVKSLLRGLAAASPADGADDRPTGDFLARLHLLAGPPAAAPGPRSPLDSPSPLDPPNLLDPPSPLGRPGAAGPFGLDPVGSRSTRPMRPVGRAGRSPYHSARPRDNRPAGRAAAVAHRQSRRRYLVVGAATLFIGFGAASYAAGGRQETPTVTPAFDRFAVEHALTSGDAPMTDPLTDPVNQIKTSPGP